MGFPGGSVVKNPPAIQEASRRHGFDPCLGRSPGEGNGNPLQYSRLVNLMDGGAWWAEVHGVAQSRTPLRDWTTDGKPVRTMNPESVLKQTPWSLGQNHQIQSTRTLNSSKWAQLDSRNT